MAYIDNLVQGLILSAEYFGLSGEIFWIADEEPYSMKEIVFTVKSLLKNDFGLPVSPKQIYLPSVVSDFARVADFMSQSLGLYVQKIHVLSEMNQTIACSTVKAKDILGYKPVISLEEGMRRSIDWCLRNNRKI
jgi:nucleoside-diphosphate-sugar epimerase